MDGSKREGGYWEKRRLALLQQMERDEAKLNDKLARTYQTEIARLDREIASYYQRYGEKNVIEYRKLLTTLSAEDRTLLIERMDEFGKKYPEYAHLLPVRESIYKLNEMEGIQLSMRMQQLEIGAIEQEALQRHLEKQALRSANLAAEQMGFGKDFYTYDASVVKATVGKAWANEQSFSERIWGNRQKLASYLNDDFAKAVARGASYEQVMKELGTRFENVSKRDMRRLVFTEGTFVFNEAHAQTHEQMFEHYTLSTASDSGVCKQCLGAEAQTRKEPVLFKDRSPGINFPPLHPGCRCSYEVAVDDWDAWIENQVSKGGGDKYGKAPTSGASAYPKSVATKEEAIVLAKASQTRVFCERGDHLIQDARNVKVDDDSYRVVMHGDPGICYLYGHIVTAKEFADVIRSRNDYNGESLSLVSCSLGDARSGVPFAQELADELGVSVTAPTRKIWTWGTPEYIIADKIFGPVNKGKFKTFEPQK